MRRLVPLHVNGEEHEVAVSPQTTLLEALRYGLKLTGSKQGCDKGDCGACTVIVDDKAVLSCVALAMQHVGAKIETVEGLGDAGGPSPVQRAFDACGALQCGFCQPGMIASATALLRQNPKPSDSQVREALARNLCRCTGYTKIIEAVRAAGDARSVLPDAADGTFPQQVPMPHGPPVPGFQVIGRRARKADAIGKATGATAYADDIALPRMAFGRILRSPHTHARIRSVDTSRAAAMPGVYAVMVGRDLPTPFCVIPWTPDEHALAVDKVRYVGDGVAAVAAVDEATADAALAAIVVDYEVLPDVLDPSEALAPGAPLVHDTDWKGRPRTDNICKDVSLSFGDVDDALARSACRIAGEWHYSGSTHAAIEPHCAVASWSADGNLTLWSATQVSHYLHREIAKVLDIPEGRVRVIQPAVGGGFGGKSEPFDLEFCAAWLARAAGRPVKILYTREEVFYAHRGRHPMDFRFELGVSADGRIEAVDSNVVIDGGAYHSFGLVTTYYAGQLLPGPMRFGTYRFNSKRVYTNKPCCGPKRGHGSVQPRFPFETALDEAAEKLAIDPIDIRRRNAMEGGERTVNGQLVPSCGILECLDAVERASGWRERYANLPAGRGLGVATSMYISGTAYPIYPNDMPQSGVSIQADRSGRLTVFTGANDIGQGSSAVIAAIVAEETGVPPEWITVVAGDTDLTPVDLGSYSSRVTFMAGTAAIEAGQALRHILCEAVAAHWTCAAEDVVPLLGKVIHRADPNRAVDIITALRLAEARLGRPAIASGGYRTRAVGGDYRGGTIGASPAYSATAHVAEVNVDADTGVVRVERIWAAHDCGRALQPVLVEGQIEGSVYMGMSEALYEDHAFYDGGGNVGPRVRGKHRGPNLLDYRLATSLDTPEVLASIVESIDPGGPYGAKEAGEGPLHPAIPAIANAIWRATGARLRTMPFTPDRVLRAMGRLDS